MQLGICQTAVCQGVPETSVLLEAVSKLGITAVEPFFGGTDDERLRWSREEMNAFAEKATEMGIEIPSVAVGIFNGNPALVQPDRSEEAVGIINNTINFTAACGGSVMLLCTYVESNPDTPEKRSCLVDVIKKVEPFASEKGVTIALESPLPAETLLALVGNIGSDNVGIYYDTGNAVYLGFDPVNEIQILDRWIRGVHVKDMVDALPGVHMGEGRVDLKASMQALRHINYAGWIMLEPPFAGPEILQEDIDKIKEYMP